MTHSLYWFCVLMSVLGQLAHLFLIKIPSIKEKCRALNKKFTWAEWWACDWNIVIGTQVIICLSIFGLDEILKWKPAILNYVKWFFAGVGAFGSTIAMAKGSQFEKSLIGLIDIKSNVSDQVIGSTSTVKETISKAQEAGITVESTK